MLKLTPKLNNKKAFTLIELLVVIAIIGVLATFIVASFGSAQTKARDSRRKSDLDALKKALELAKNDSVGATFYPGCAVGNPCTINVTTGATFNPNIVTNSYIRVVPNDPSNNSSSPYQYIPGCTGSYCAPTFQLKACLENATDPSGVAPTAPCVAGQLNYIVSSN